MFLWAALEWAWATAPATRLSSVVMLAGHVVMLGGLWFEAARVPREKDTKMRQKIS